MPRDAAGAHGLTGGVQVLRSSVATMGRVADEFVVLQTPAWFLSIGEHYRDFRQTSDAEVVACLQRPPTPAMGHVA